MNATVSIKIGRPDEKTCGRDLFHLKSIHFYLFIFVNKTVDTKIKRL